MKKLELYLYIVLGLIALLPFLAWIALSAYYLLRWCVWRVRSESKKSRRAKA